MFEIWIATWLAYSFCAAPSFAVFKSSPEAIVYLKGLIQKDTSNPEVQQGKICLRHIRVKKIDKKGIYQGVEMNMQNLILRRKIEVSIDK